MIFCHGTAEIERLKLELDKVVKVRTFTKTLNDEERIKTLEEFRM